MKLGLSNMERVYIGVVYKSEIDLSQSTYLLLQLQHQLLQVPKNSRERRHSVQGSICTETQGRPIMGDFGDPL